jgi:hypothetical protein
MQVGCERIAPSYPRGSQAPLTECGVVENPFNATFFATVAVVLPVIFLALALQSDYIVRTMLTS